MKGERIYAEVVAIIGLLLYLVVFQHIYAEMLGHAERSWLNQLRAWWVTRESRRREQQLNIWNLKEASTEPKPKPAS